MPRNSAINRLDLRASARRNLDKARKGPQIGRFARPAQNSENALDWVVVDAVMGEPVSAANSLLTGTLQGILAIFGIYERIWPHFMAPVQWFGHQIPYSAEQGIFWGEHGIQAEEQAIAMRYLDI